ncbi:MAG: Capsule assembly protein Wzi, partial [Gemmatimonadetes bacterium]|nr:Capsule assembly protein Wzi [Gemmatimonadota bacterium]
GLAFPAIGADGRVAFTLELHHTGRRFGRHLQFESGATLDRTPLGDPLGPDADGGYLVVEREWTRGIRAEMELAEEVYRDNDYTITTNPFAFHLATTRPQERRHRASLTVRRVAAPGMELVLEGGAEWIRDSGFRAGESHVGGMARVGWRWLVH